MTSTSSHEVKYVKNVSRKWLLATQNLVEKKVGWRNIFVDVNVQNQFGTISCCQFDVNSWHHKSFNFDLWLMVSWHQPLTSFWCQFNIFANWECHDKNLHVSFTSLHWFHFNPLFIPTLYSCHTQDSLRYNLLLLKQFTNIYEEVLGPYI